jgi:ATP-dependent protease HslVU (ClpYQ) peptidase subunit
MTCIVGISNGTTVFLGGDSASVGGLSLSRTLHPKVFQNGPYIMGYTTSFRMGQLLEFGELPEPNKHDRKNLYRFMVTKFVPAIRKIFKDGGFSKVSNSVEEGGTFLVGLKGEFFIVDSDYQVQQKPENFYACGCGEDIALGAMYATKGQSPKDRLRIALEAAEQYSGGVSGPFHFVQV